MKRARKLPGTALPQENSRTISHTQESVGMPVTERDKECKIPGDCQGAAPTQPPQPSWFSSPVCHQSSPNPGEHKAMDSSLPPDASASAWELQSSYSLLSLLILQHKHKGVNLAASWLCLLLHPASLQEHLFPWKVQDKC